MVPSTKEEEPVKLSQIDKILFENFGKDSPVIPVGVYPWYHSVVDIFPSYYRKSNDYSSNELFLQASV